MTSSEPDRKMENVAEVVVDELCTGYGTCAGVCPSQAVQMRLFHGLCLPLVDERKCTHCHLCIESCAGYSVDFTWLNYLVFQGQPEDAFLGHKLGCFVGHSRDDGIRDNCSSGGIVTHLLVFALEKGLIDGVLTIRMKTDNPLEAEPTTIRFVYEFPRDT